MLLKQCDYERKRLRLSSKHSELYWTTIITTIWNFCVLDCDCLTLLAIVWMEL